VTCPRSLSYALGNGQVVHTRGGATNLPVTERHPAEWVPADCDQLRSKCKLMVSVTVYFAHNQRDVCIQLRSYCTADERSQTAISMVSTLAVQAVTWNKKFSCRKETARLLRGSSLFSITVT